MFTTQNQSSSCHLNLFLLQSQEFSEHIKRAENDPNTKTFMEPATFFRFILVCQDGWPGFHGTAVQTQLVQEETAREPGL